MIDAVPGRASWVAVIHQTHANLKNQWFQLRLVQQENRQPSPLLAAESAA